MKYELINGDLFSELEGDFYFAHCISADFGMGAGIVVLFNRHFDLKNKINHLHRNYENYYVAKNIKGDCLVADRVLNLITKHRYFQKPTMASMEQALIKMKEIVLKKSIKEIRMPMIGAGLDKLNWTKVSKMIQDIFKDTKVSIKVYYI